MEARYPYLDLSVIDCARNTPPDLALKEFEEKYVVKQLARDYVPREILEREKFAFHANPSSDLIRLEKSSVERYLSPQRIRREGYFNPESGSVAARQVRGQGSGRESVVRG